MKRILILLAIVSLSACVSEREQRAAAAGAIVGAAVGVIIASENEPEPAYVPAREHDGYRSVHRDEQRYRHRDQRNRRER